MARAPAYSRLSNDERRAQLLEAGRTLFAEHAYEEISMQQIATAAGISKPLLYHYFPSKTALFKAALAEQAQTLQALLEPPSDGTPFEQLRGTLDAYLGWIEENARAWRKLMRTAATLPEAGEIVEGFRRATLEQVLDAVSPGAPRPALRNAVRGWLGYIDAALLDWTGDGGLDRDQVREMIIAAFGAALLSAQQADPEITLQLS